MLLASLTRISRMCLLGAALVGILSGAAFAQRGERGGGGDRGGRMGGGGQGQLGGAAHGNVQSFSGRSEGWSGGDARGWQGNRGWGDWDNRGLARNWGGWGWGGIWPGYAYRYGSPGYYDYYGYYGYPYYGGYYGDYGYGYGGFGYPYSSGYAATDVGPAVVATDSITGSIDYYSRALAAFRQGDYRAALPLAGHAAIDHPQDRNVHLLLLLSMFASGDYRGAAMEGHALASTGDIPNWNTVYGFYGNVEPYTSQLRALEKFVKDHPTAPEGHFLLGLQYAMAGHRDPAQREMLAALKITPQDRFAAQLLTHEGGTVPSDIATQLSQATPPRGEMTAKPPQEGQPGNATPPASSGQQPTEAPQPPLPPTPPHG